MTINSFGVYCPGCDVELTVENAGGYRHFCRTCVEAMPPLPTAPAGTAFIITGTYPNFEWHAAVQMVVKPKLSQWPNFTDEDIPQ